MRASALEEGEEDRDRAHALGDGERRRPQDHQAARQRHEGEEQAEQGPAPHPATTGHPVEEVAERRRREQAAADGERDAEAARATRSRSSHDPLRPVEDQAGRRPHHGDADEQRHERGQAGAEPVPQGCRRGLDRRDVDGLAHLPEVPDRQAEQVRSREDDGEHEQPSPLHGARRPASRPTATTTIGRRATAAASQRGERERAALGPHGDRGAADLERTGRH